MREVALRKESVDRNMYLTKYVQSSIRSLSVRRAWIEIWKHSSYLHHDMVALRKESVDRNTILTVKKPDFPVALRKESVDRNLAVS